MKDFYYILGVNSDCALDEIKEAYRKLSKKFHPDLNQGDTYFEDRFKEINEAYETLSDPDKRYGYDEGLKQFKSKSANEGYKRQRYYYQQNEHRKRQTQRSASIPKRGPGVGISIILIVIALIVSIYIVESFSNSKKIKVKEPPVITAVSNKAHRHHKRKHGLKSNAGDSSRLSQTSLKPLSASTASSAKPAETVQDKQPLLPAIKKTDDSGPYLYTAYVRANITGVINLRKVAAYGSDVISTIPANAKVFVLQKGDAYDKVSYNNITGYVPQWSIKTNK